MSQSANVRSIQALEELKGALNRFGGEAQESLSAAEVEIRRTFDWLRERQNHWHNEVCHWREEVTRAEAALATCRTSGYTDRNGHHHAPNCSAHEQALHQAQAHLREAQAELHNVQEWTQRVQQANADYQRQAQRLATMLGSDLPRGTALLGRKIATLRSYVTLQAPPAAGAPSPVTTAQAAVATTLISTLTNLGGGHGPRYQTARQQFLRSLIDDPQQPRYVHGWIKQELHRLEQVKTAREAGTQPPGGNQRRVRGIPGLDVGHRYPDIDLPESFRLEDAAMNRARPGIARRLGLSDWLH